MAKSPSNTASKSAFAPVAEETLDFDDVTLKGGRTHEEVDTV